jgi:alpha/beta superfamily hydrolase
MEVLRESLELLARLVDERLGRPRKEPGTQANPVSASDAVECFFFGADDSLYGVFHGSATEAAQALLVCSPIGQESVRAHFVLQKLSRQLAEQGTPVLRFDYFGTGNSSGNDIDASIERWRSDVVEAFRELRRRVPSARITVLGARLGASLAWSVLREIDFAHLVVWDPIVNGGEHVRELRAQHQAQVRELQSLRSGRWPRALRGGEELAGFTFSRVALEQLQRLVLDEPSFAQRGSIDWIGSAPDTVQRRLHEVYSSGHFKSIDYNCEWSSSRPAAEILPDVGFSRAVIALMQSDGT